MPVLARQGLEMRRPINARAESVATSGMFRGAFASRCCLVPAMAFYESKRVTGGKQPCAVARADGQPMAFAGLWEGWRGPDGTVLRTFVMITTRPNCLMAELRDRMPAVIERAHWPVWLGEAEGDPAGLLHPPAEDVLRAWPVSREVNSPANDGAALLLPLA